MIPISFPEQTFVIAKDQPEYLPLPAHVTPSGDVTSCWQMDWRERLSALLIGRVYVTSRTFRKPLQPLLVGTTKPDAPSNAR